MDRFLVRSFLFAVCAAALQSLAAPAWSQAQPSQQAPASPQASTPQPGTPQTQPPEVPALPKRAPTAIEKPIGSEVDTLAATALPIQRTGIPASVTFKIATWHLKARKPSESEQQEDTAAQPKQKKWRTTFGSERRTAKWREFGKKGFAADIIALQGVDSYRNVRRVFNARRYHVIASRQLLARSTSTSTGIAVFRADAPATTAIAFRRRRGVRPAGFRHFVPRATRSKPEAIAITAFRLRVYGKPFWIASLDIPADCTAELETDKCRPYGPVVAQFEGWAKRQKSPLLMLGQWPPYIIDLLKNAGIAMQAEATAKVECKPQPSGFYVGASDSSNSATLKIENSATAKSNPCVATSDLTFNLR